MDASSLRQGWEESASGSAPRGANVNGQGRLAQLARLSDPLDSPHGAGHRFSQPTSRQSFRGSPPLRFISAGQRAGQAIGIPSDMPLRATTSHPETGRATSFGHALGTAGVDGNSVIGFGPGFDGSWPCTTSPRFLTARSKAAPAIA